MNNLWPDFTTEVAVDSPKQVVDEAGEGIKDRTNGKIVFYFAGIAIQGDKATAQYSLIARSLNYAYPFARLSFSLRNPYPAEFVTADNNRPLVANSREELLAGLAEVFRSEATVNIIRQLLSLMR